MKIKNNQIHPFALKCILSGIFLIFSLGIQAQVDSKSGSFKIPAVVDTTGTPTAIPAENEAKPDLKLSRGGLQLDAQGKLKERPELKAPESLDFYMMKREDFADAGQKYTDMMNEREAKRTSDREALSGAARNFEGAIEVYEELGETKRAYVIEKNLSRVKRLIDATGGKS